MRTKAGAFIVVALLGLSGAVSFRLPPLEFVTGFLSRALTPAEQAVADPARQAGDFFATIREMGQLRAENARLREELGKARGEAARLGEVMRENEQLRDQLKLKSEQPSYEWLTARVIGRDASNLLRSVAIDRGSNDGLTVGMTVITPAGLAGQIVRVGPTTARVLLITDIASSVTALIQAPRAEGVVNGRNQSYLQMRYIPQPANVKTGDRVITSGVGGVFPAGIPIGRVISVSKKDIETFQEAQIEPEVDFQHLESVLVITNHVPLRIE